MCCGSAERARSDDILSSLEGVFSHPAAAALANFAAFVALAHRRQSRRKVVMLPEPSRRRRVRRVCQQMLGVELIALLREPTACFHAHTSSRPGYIVQYHGR